VRCAKVAGVPLAYLAMAFGTTFPLVRGVTTTFPGGHTDVFGFLWNNWWIYHAVTHHLSKPYLSSFIFAPFRLDLRLHTIGFLYGLLSIPLFPILGQVGVLNVQIFATIVLNGYLTFALVNNLVKDRAIAFAMGLLAASLHAINFHIASGRPSCASFWTAIAVILSFLRLVERPGAAQSGILTISIFAMFLADQQIVLFGILWLVLLGTISLIQHPTTILNRRLLLTMLVPVLGAAIASYALYFRPLRFDVGYNVPGAAEALTYSTGPAFLRSPHLLWTVYGALVPLGIPLAIFRLRRVPRATPWIVGAILFFVLAMGPVWGSTAFPLPFALLRRLPGMVNYRMPYRFQMPAALGAIVAMGMLLRVSTQKLGPRARLCLIFGLVLAIAADATAHWRDWPFYVRRMPDQPLYDVIGRDPSGGVLLEIPVGVRHGTDRIGQDGEILTFYQPVHQMRLVNGFVARAPDAALAYYRRSPALMFFANEDPPAGDLEADLKQQLKELDVKYIVVHPPMIKSERLGLILSLLSRVDGLQKIANGPELVAFRYLPSNEPMKNSGSNDSAGHSRLNF
jgi:hypothetical protein